MADAFKVETNEIEQLARKIDSCYRDIYSGYKRDISSIRSEVERLAAKYSDYSSVVSSARGILSSLREIEQKTSQMSQMSQELVKDTKQAASLYKESEYSAKTLINKKSPKTGGKIKPVKTIAAGASLIQSNIGEEIKKKVSQLDESLQSARKVTVDQLMGIKKYFSDMKNKVDNKLSEIKKAWCEQAIRLCDKAKEGWNALCDEFSKIKDGICRWIDNLIKEAREIGKVISESWNKFLKASETAIESFMKKAGDWFEGIKNGLIDCGNQIKEEVGKIYNSASNFVSEKIEEIKASLDSVKKKIAEGWESIKNNAKAAVTKLINDVAVSLQGEKKFKIPFGPTVTFYAEAYSDYSTFTIGSGVDSEGKIKEPGANIFPSSEIGKIQGDIDSEGNFKGSVGISDENGTTVWTDETGKITYSIRKKTDCFATTASAYVSAVDNKTGAGYAIDTRGNNYEEGPWGKIGVKVEWEKKEPSPTAVVTVEEPETESVWDKAWDGVVAAKDWVVDGAVGIYEGAKDVCSDVGDWIVDHKEVVIATTLTTAVVITAVALAPETGGASLGLLAV